MKSITAAADTSLSRKELEAVGLVIPESTQFRVRRLHVGERVSIGAGVRLAGDDVSLGDGVVVSAGADIRSTEIRIGSRCEIGPRTRILCSDAFVLGEAGRLAASVNIVCRSFEAGCLFFMGNDSAVGYGGTLEADSRVVIGDRVAVGPFSVLNANRQITLGDDVGTGGYVSLWTHGFHFAHSILDGFAAIFEPIVVENKVWLSYHTSVMPGVTIGEGCIVAAGGVVTRSSDPWRLLAGVPAVPKAQLERRALDDDQAEALVSATLDGWAEEFTYKTDEPVERIGASWRMRYRGTRYAVVLGNRVDDSSPDRCIRVLVDGEADTPVGPSESRFVLRRGLLDGLLDDVSEDLRDYFRRHTMPCGTSSTFQSITPRSFARWQNVFD